MAFRLCPRVPGRHNPPNRPVKRAAAAVVGPVKLDIGGAGQKVGGLSSRRRSDAHHSSGMLLRLSRR